MTELLILISPEAKQAYFADYHAVIEAELKAVYPEAMLEMLQRGPFEFAKVSGEVEPAQLLALSFAQGLFEQTGDSLKPVEQTMELALHEDFIFGSKYKGKTNERLTQMLINVGLAQLPAHAKQQTVSVLDPMCGRGTTLFWALAYGLKARGIEQDKKALEDIQRNVKKWTKLHRVKHKLREGFIGKANKQNNGKYLDLAVNDSSLRAVIGDARKADEIFSKEKFDLIISDLPYGVQHTTEDNTRNPIEVIQQAIPAWQAVLKKHGLIVLAFNRNNPRRAFMEKTFSDSGMQVLEFGAGHRMSESIVRDVIIIKHG